MSYATEVTYERLSLRVRGVELAVAACRRRGGLAPIVFLHGFGSTKARFRGNAQPAPYAFHRNTRQRQAA